VQTFLPYEDYALSARCLDQQRLGKQRIEARTIYNIITDNYHSTAWTNHPAVNMWRGYDESLGDYFNAISLEWIRRGYTHTMGFIKLDRTFIEKPPWLNIKLITSHRSNLLRKNPQWYKQYNWHVRDNIPYWWPTKEGF
jgi:hypothetical protein